MNIRVTHFPGSAYRVMPWKNGKGSTTELCISPAEGSVQDGFDWRISLAQVPESGPFSAFPLHERIIMLLTGDPMRIVHDGYGEHLLQTFQPYNFRGLWNTSGILTGKPAYDFNVMVREGWGHAGIQVHRGTENIVLNHRPAAIQFIWAYQGAAQIDLYDRPYHLLENESYMIENGPDLLLRMMSPTSTVITVNIEILSK